VTDAEMGGTPDATTGAVSVHAIPIDGGQPGLDGTCVQSQFVSFMNRPRKSSSQESIGQKVNENGERIETNLDRKPHADFLLDLSCLSHVCERPIDRLGRPPMRQIATKDEFDALLAQNSASSTTTFVDFTATWCGPCQRIGPIFEALAKEFPQATFVKVDVDENQETARAYAVRAMPTFQTFVKKNKVDDLTGADEAGLRAMVMKHAGSKFVGAGHTLGGSATATTAGMTDREKRLAALERRGLGGGSGSSDAPPLDHSSKPQAVAAAASAIAPAASASAPPAPPPAPVRMPASAQPVSAPAPAAPPPPAAPPMAPPPVLPAVSPAAGAIAQLQAMGFADVEAIKLALEASNGDVEQALALLVE